AGEELPEAAELDDHRRAAVLALLVGRDGLLLAPLDISLEGFQVARELLVELAERGRPRELALFDLVKLLLHPRRVGLVEEVVEATLDQKVVDGHPERRRVEATLDALDVLAILNRRHDGRVRRGTTDALLFERLDERRLGVARRRL